MGPSSFAQLLQQALDEAGLNQSTFGVAVGHPRAFINQVLKGKRTPPLDRIGTWADALGLKGSGRERFVDLAALVHLPKEVRPRFEQWYEEHQRLRTTAAQLSAEAERLRKIVEKSK